MTFSVSQIWQFNLCHYDILKKICLSRFYLLQHLLHLDLSKIFRPTLCSYTCAQYQKFNSGTFGYLHLLLQPVDFVINYPTTRTDVLPCVLRFPCLHFTVSIISYRASLETGSDFHQFSHISKTPCLTATKEIILTLKHNYAQC